MHQTELLYSTVISTPLGQLTAIADTLQLYLLEFTDHPKIVQRVTTLQQKNHAIVVSQRNNILHALEDELAVYFRGELTTFNTPIALFQGTPFQQDVWKALLTIPYGHTRSYANIAQQIGTIKAYRAVGSANGVNPFPLIIPCHRVINTNGTISGYRGGVTRKQWLLHHEKHHYVK